MVPEPSIMLDDVQQAALLPQVEAFIAAAADDNARQPYAALRAALTVGEVTESSAELLGKIVEVLLTSGRIRSVYGPGAELSLWSLFQKTPQGRVMLASVNSLNQALKPLAGVQIEAITAAARGPSTYALTLRTDRLQMVVRFEAAGVRVENIELGS